MNESHIGSKWQIWQDKRCHHSNNTQQDQRLGRDALKKIFVRSYNKKNEELCYNGFYEPPGLKSSLPCFQYIQQHRESDDVEQGTVNTKNDCVFPDQAHVPPSWFFHKFCIYRIGRNGQVGEVRNEVGK